MSALQERTRLIGMQIIVEIHQDTEGRPIGTVRSGDSDVALPFSGNLEFLALIEGLYRVENATSDKS